MTDGKKTEQIEGFTPAELALLKAKQPDMLTDIEAGIPAAEEIARMFLTTHGSGEATRRKATTTPPSAVQLPLWPEHLRAVPNTALRSALFGATIHKGGRIAYREPIAALAGIEITYSGPRLNQGDLDAWEAILHTLRGQNMGDTCRTTSYHLLKVMGLSNNGQNQKTLESRIARLNESAIKIQYGRYLYMGSLLDRAARDEVTQEWVIVLNPDLLDLFGPGRHTRLQWEVRRALAAKPLAQWLHGFFSSHAKPYPIKIETLYKLSGSEAGELKTFTQKLKKSLTAVEAASTAAGEVFNWRIEKGIVYVNRTPPNIPGQHGNQ